MRLAEKIIHENNDIIIFRWHEFHGDKLTTVITIKKVWFNKTRIYMETNNGETFSRPLEAFPVLKEATLQQRNYFTLANIELIFDGKHWTKTYISIVSLMPLNRIIIIVLLSL